MAPWGEVAGLDVPRRDVSGWVVRPVVVGGLETSVRLRARGLHVVDVELDPGGERRTASAHVRDVARRLLETGRPVRLLGEGAVASIVLEVGADPDTTLTGVAAIMHAGAVDLDALAALRTPALIVAAGINRRTRRRATRMLPRGSSVRTASVDAEADESVVAAWLHGRLGLDGRTRRRRFAVRVVPVTAAALATVGVSTSAAEPACETSFSDGVVDITCAGERLEMKLSVGPDGELLFDGAAIEGATLDTTTLLQLTSGPGDDSLLVDNSANKLFDALEIKVDLGDGDNALLFVGSKIADLLVMTPAGLDVGSDESVDLAVLGASSWKLDLGGGADKFDGRASLAPLLLDGGAGDDLLVGSKLDDLLIGGDGDNQVDGEDGFDLLQSADTTLIKMDADAISGPSGKVSFVNVEAASLQLLDAGIIDATAGKLDLTLLGSSGDDQFKLGAAASKIDGAGGYDLLVAASNDDYKIDTTTLTSKLTTATFTNTEAASLQLLDAGIIDATAGKLDLTLLGSSGDDQFKLGAAASKIDGAGGYDLLVASDQRQLKMTATLLQGTSFLAEHSKIESAELQLLSVGTIDAVGFKGEIKLHGSSGDDTLLAGGGNDVISAGLGDDIVDGGGGFDVLVEAGDVDYKLEDKRLIGLGTDSLAGFERVALTGGESANKIDARLVKLLTVELRGLGGDDLLVGGALGDLLDGGFGNDDLSGGKGGDTLLGGPGADRLRGEQGDDVLIGGTESDSSIGNGDDAGDIGDAGEGTDRCSNIESTTGCET